MVFLFNLIDVPLFEILLVLMVLLLVGLILVLLEVKKLKRLIKRETADVTRFEMDLSKIEKIPNITEKKQIQKYVNRQQVKGVPNTRITNVFLDPRDREYQWRRTF